uniref:Secondary ossification center associated regulator of chondrocyte maturation n=1 Tax=Poecilia formosa TaxID=48698 RepID=A0A096M0Z4_POEFO
MDAFTVSNRLSVCLFVCLLGNLVEPLHLCAETVLDPALSSRDHQDAMSGDPPVWMTEVTTKSHFLDNPGQTYTFDFEDSTQPPILDEGEGVLGPGAITAIVVAVFLGASVLLALIVITIRKFTAS